MGSSESKHVAGLAASASDMATDGHVATAILRPVVIVIRTLKNGARSVTRHTYIYIAY